MPRPGRGCDNGLMELAYGLPVLAALVIAWVAVRAVVARRKRSLQAYTRTRDQRLRASKSQGRRSSRAEMRANDNPTTVIDTIQTQPRKPRPDRP